MRRSPGPALLCALLACGDDAAGTATDTAGTATDTAGTATDTAGTDTNDDPQLAACHALPAAALAEWIEGPSLAPTGESTEARIAAAGAPTWELALDLLRVIDPAQNPSLAASPASMTFALGLGYARWQGDVCGDEIHARMRFPELGDPVHQTLGASIRELEGLSLPVGQDGEDRVDVSFRPSIWSLEGPPMGAPLYGAKTHQVTKGGADKLAAIREVMNCVIEAESAGLLPNFVPSDHPQQDSVAYYVNASFLQAPWRVGLSGRGALPFTRDDGQVVNATGIGSTSVPATYYEGSSFDALTLQLRGGRLAVTFVTPKPDVYADLGAFTAALTPAELAAVRTSSVHSDVDLTIPVVKIQSETLDYYDPLGFMCPLFTLRSVLHGATVEIDEKGIKAAAATAGEEWSTGTGPPPPDRVVVLDRPFLFFVHDTTTQFVLYNGRYAGPP